MTAASMKDTLLMTIWRLTLVLILYVGSYPGTIALGQRFRETTSPGTETQVVVRAESTGGAGSVSTLPDAPGVALQQYSQSNPVPIGARDAAAGGQVPNSGKQTKRILYIIPNFRSVSVDEKLPPQTIKDKFTTGALDSFDYSSFIFVAIQAGVAQARNSTPEFRQGAAGYGRYYWHTYADYVDENLWVEFIFPTVLHQDSRYYTLGRGGFVKRLGYSMSRTVITRKDSGHEAFNSSEIFGAGAAAGVSSLYYPSQERTFTKTYEIWLTSIAIDAGSNLFKEFWPDINNKVFHQK